MGTGTPASRFMATAWAVIQMTAKAMRSTPGQSVTPPSAMIKQLVHAGAWGQDKRIKSPQVTARASDALMTGANPPV